jgi:hypothetical protein
MILEYEYKTPARKFVNRNLNLGLDTSYKIHSECLNLFLYIIIIHCSQQTP